MTLQALYNITAKACLIPNKRAKVYVDVLRKNYYSDSKKFRKVTAVLDENEKVIIYNITFINGDHDTVKIAV